MSALAPLLFMLHSVIDFNALQSPLCSARTSDARLAPTSFVRRNRVQSVAGFGVVGLAGPRPGTSSGVLPGSSSGGVGVSGSRTGGGTSG